MSADLILLLSLGLIVIAAVAVAVAYATAYTARRDFGAAPGEAAGPGLRDHDDGPPELRQAVGPADATAGPGSRPRSGFIASTSTRQVARVVAFLYLASVAVVVALSDAWPESQPAIFSLLAAGTLLVVLFMDLVPPAALGRWRRPVEGVGAVIFLGLLAALTGGAGSPFFVGFFLVVAGASLSTEGRAPLAIALLAAATVVLVGLGDALETPLQAEELAWVGFNAVALILLADIATAAARAQRHARDEALRASRFDALTGLYNRAFFVTTMEQEIRRSDRMGRGFTMLMLDLDDLKPVNDTFGHQWGDRLLRTVADTIRRTVRFTDAAARYGGDEFVILLPETDAAGGYVVGEKLRRDIAAVTLRAAGRSFRSTVSVGLVTYPDDGSTIEALVAAADVAMYESKRRGKNRIVGYQTRTERVATAIDIETGEGLTRTPAEDARTGGDPAPWGVLPGGGDAPTVLPHSVSVEEPGHVPQRTRPDAASRPPDAGGRTPEASGRLPEARGRPPEAGGLAPDAGGLAPDASGPPPAAGRLDPDAQASASAPDVPPSGALTTRGDARPPGAEVRPADASARSTGQPWLTRTDDAWTPPPRAPGQPRPPEAPSQRPAADLGAGGGSFGRSGSRSEEIRSEDRPWIALPIEPYEPPDRPGR